MPIETRGEVHLNPSFGRGIFRRRVRLIAGTGRVRAGLEDTSHSMWVELQHDGERVTSIDCAMPRIPMTVCSGASAPLQTFIGLPLAPYPARPSATASARANCTHLHHLALLAMAHARRGGTRQYDVEIPDEKPDAVWSSVLRDGVVVHRWQTFNGQIVGPDEFAGLALTGGVARWAPDRFQGDELEAAFVLGNAYVVSWSRRYDTEAWAGKRADAHSNLVGKCYGYQADVVKDGVYLSNSTRDTTSPDTPLLVDFD